MTQEEKSKLTHFIAELVRARLPEDAEDFPAKISGKALGVIEKHNERLRQLACDLTDLRDYDPSRTPIHCLACGSDQVG